MPFLKLIFPTVPCCLNMEEMKADSDEDTDLISDDMSWLF